MRRVPRRHTAGKQKGSPTHERWLLSYADFVTLLLAVFIVLFAASSRNGQSIRTVSTAIHSGFDALSVSPPQEPSTPDRTPPAREAPRTASLPASAHFDTGELRRQLQSVLGEAISKQQIVMQQTPDGLIISLRELGFFSSGKATLLPGAAERLRRTAAVLMQHGLEVRVEGHSDDEPIHTEEFHSNWELSTARAMTVLSILLDQTGFPPTKVSVAGYGAYHPVADNATPAGRRKNRRVDLVVIAPKSRDDHLP